MTRRRGVALIEVVVALAILFTTGAAAAGLTLQLTESAQRARDTEQAYDAADKLMQYVALWPVEDLDRRLGSRRQGPWRLNIERVSANVYEATLYDSLERTPIVRTAIYRPTPTGSMGRR